MRERNMGRRQDKLRKKPDDWPEEWEPVNKDDLSESGDDAVRRSSRKDGKKGSLQ